MMPLNRIENLSVGLNAIVDTSSVGQKQKRLAQSLLRRFGAPISVCIMGLDDRTTDRARAGLTSLADDPRVKLWTYEGDLTPQARTFAGIDLAIWCSAAFGPEEERIWNHAPDTLMDRSVLVCWVDHTSTLAQPPQTDLFEEVQLVRSDASSEPLHLLSNKVLSRVRDGLRADADAAAILIESCGMSITDQHATPLVPQTAPRIVQITEGHRETLIVQADKVLSDHANALQKVDLDDDVLSAHVLASCETVCETLVQLFENACQSSVSDALANDIHDAQDAIVLMGLEGGADAAADAVTTLIQLRKDFFVEQAA